jgi:dTDP-3-amino-3,4,6-trideoxy-alpha-D-glucose transaminase
MSELPLVDLKAQYRTIAADVQAAIERVLARQQFINGPETAAFEREFAAACEASQCVAVSSGTTALELALRAMGVGPGDEVVTVSHTFLATVSAVANTGATPVLVDVDEETWTMAPAAVAEAIRPRTKAIVPVHLYGHPADIDAIAAAAPGVPVVEDAAQAHLARYRGRAVGSSARAACYSFYPGKNLGAYGDAGAVVTNDPALADRLRALRDHGRRVGGKYEHEILGTNARASELQTAILRAKLPHLPAWTHERQRLSVQYEDALARLDLPVQRVQPWAEHARHLFVLLHADRERLLRQLRARGIGAGVHYPIPCHLQPAVTDRCRVAPSALARTEVLAQQCLSLPLYPELGDDGVRRVVAALTDALLAAAA